MREHPGLSRNLCLNFFSLPQQTFSTISREATMTVISGSPGLVTRMDIVTWQVNIHYLDETKHLSSGRGLRRFGYFQRKGNRSSDLRPLAGQGKRSLPHDWSFLRWISGRDITIFLDCIRSSISWASSPTWIRREGNDLRLISNGLSSLRFLEPAIRRGLIWWERRGERLELIHRDIWNEMTPNILIDN